MRVRGAGTRVFAFFVGSSIFLALSCPTKDTSCIASDGHSNVLTTTTEAENVQECGSKYLSCDEQVVHIFIVYDEH